jgi:hypothetical protein
VKSTGLCDTPGVEGGCGEQLDVQLVGEERPEAVGVADLPDLDPAAGMTGSEDLGDPVDELGDSGAEKADPQLALGAPARRDRPLEARHDLLVGGGDVVVQPPSDRRQLDLTAGPPEELRPDPPLQLLDRLADPGR